MWSWRAQGANGVVPEDLGDRPNYVDSGFPTTFCHIYTMLIRFCKRSLDTDTYVTGTKTFHGNAQFRLYIRIHGASDYGVADLDGSGRCRFIYSRLPILEVVQTSLDRGRTCSQKI